ncbi:class I SAM-dependent methyltransferase [Romboutsia sp. Marseille-P6047]|uniref:class I SAM-dependent methyltransferase n=1 Tax=Romboutsia sp. Marseille-P6047 TaxID=2161817 RepID=UPI000F04D950|nr:class I SAM-dependent methyltransferase [Romboutsia sp. Marseille-P6047]
MRDYTDYRGSVFENEKKLWNKGATSKLEFNYDELEDYKREILKNLILKNVNKKNKIKILDIETGNGFFATIMAEEGHNVTAIDSSSKIISSINNNNLSKNKVKINFKTMHKSSLDFKDKSFDLIISSNIVWKLQSPEISFREWRRVLKDDGVLVYFDSNWSTEENIESRPLLDKEILRKSGFSDVSIDQNLYKLLWHEKGVLSYKPKSIFMVIAKK